MGRKKQDRSSISPTPQPGVSPLQPSLTDVAAQKQLAQSTLQEGLARRLGTGWETSTPAIETQQRLETGLAPIEQQLQAGQITAQQAIEQGEQVAGTVGGGQSELPLRRSMGGGQSLAGVARTRTGKRPIQKFSFGRYNIGQI